MGKMIDKESLIVEIEQSFNQNLYSREGLCLHYSHYTLKVLHKYGLKAVLQAGSMQWPIIPKEDDDGISPTHFAYMWSPDTPESKFSTCLGMLPEMHVWVGLLDTQEIVDLSTQHLKAAAESMGFTWNSKDPPHYLWCSVDSLPEWVRYVPNYDATIYAYKRMADMYGTITTKN